MTVFSGVWIWIWNLDQCDGGDFDAIARRCLGAGVRGVIVKAADGASWFPQRNAAGTQPASAIVAALRSAAGAAGDRLGVATWSYCYGGDVAGETQRAVETIVQARPDAHVLDIEQEFEDGADPAGAATALVAGIRSAAPAGFELAYSPLPAIPYHLRLPYRQFSDGGLTLLPQLYWTGLAWSWQLTAQVFYDAAARYELESQPICPIYEDVPGRRPGDADVAAFASGVRGRGAPGVSVWSYEHLDGDAWRRIQSAAQTFTTRPAGQPDPCAALQQELAAATATIARLQAKIAAAAQTLSRED